MKNSKEKGITLVALAVTIVVLLILSGITVGVIVGNNSIIDKTTDTTDKAKQDASTTQNGILDVIDNMNAKIDYYPIFGNFNDIELENGNYENEYYSITNGRTFNNLKGVEIPGVGTINKCLKMEETTAITFTPRTKGIMTFYFGEESSSKSIKVNNELRTAEEGTVLDVPLDGGIKYTFTKGAEQSYIYYMVFKNDIVDIGNDSNNSTKHEIVHNFNNDGAGKISFKDENFTITGKTYTTKGSVEVPNVGTITQCLYFDTSASIVFTPIANGIIKFYFGSIPNDCTMKANEDIYIVKDVVDIKLKAHTQYTFAKKSGSPCLFYIVFAYDEKDIVEKPIETPEVKPTEPVESPEVPIEPSKAEIFHNFDNDVLEQGTTIQFSDEYFTITGNCSDGKGTLQVPGVGAVKQCLKMESSTSIVFTPPSDGTLTLYFNATSANNKNTIKVNDVAQTVTEVLNINVTGNTQYTIKKGSGSSFLYYMEFNKSE